MPTNPLNPELPGAASPLGRVFEQLAELQRRVQAAERMHPEFIVFEGPRDDLAGGRGPRTRVGKLTDGSWGIERWTQAGQRQLPTWSDA